MAELDTVRLEQVRTAQPRVFTNPTRKLKNFPLSLHPEYVAARAASLARLSSSPRCTTARGIQKNICLEGAWLRTHPFANDGSGATVAKDTPKYDQTNKGAPPSTSHRLSLLRRPPWLQNTAP
jgi:hypothetical protein